MKHPSFKTFDAIKIIPFIFLITLILMIFYRYKTNKPKPLYHRQGIEFTDQIRSKLLPRINQSGPIDEVEMILGYAFGDYRFISKELKALHNKFNLNHLFTPSAFHFSCLLNFLGPLFKIYPFIQTLTVFILSLFFLNWSPLAQCFALQRICYLKMCAEFFSRINFAISVNVLFFIIFFVDFLFGSFSRSPLSFIYSFLFYGTVLILSKHKWYELFFGIFLGQWFLTAINQSSFFPLRTLMGFFLTALIGVILPVVIIGFFCHIDFFLRLALKIVASEIALLRKADLLPTGLEIYFPKLSLVLIFLILLIWSDYFLIRQKLAKAFHNIFNLREQNVLKGRAIGDITVF